MPTDRPTSRYSRQERFAPIGELGQARLANSRALICGCGALGSLIAERLVRAGVGSIRLVDRDWVELSNLQRQTLFTEQDARSAQPKSIAAREALHEINSTLNIEAFVEDVTYENIASLARGCDLILDGTDNFETRFLINDYCVKHAVPWIHGGCLGASGQVLSILPGSTACFRCLVPELPPREAMDTCDSAGVLGPAVGLIACWQSAEAIKVLSGNLEAVCRELIVVDCWNTDVRLVKLRRQTNCSTCALQSFPFLNGEIRTESVILCGKNAVQLQMPGIPESGSELSGLADRLRSFGSVQENAFFVRLSYGDFVVTVFRGGRTVVEGTTSPAEAKSLLARTLGA